VTCHEQGTDIKQWEDFSAETCGLRENCDICKSLEETQPPTKNNISGKMIL
jgi:hypothetical protein